VREGIVDIVKRVDSTESGAVQLPTKCGLHDAGWESLDVSEKGRCSTSSTIWPRSWPGGITIEDTC
jgi:hypothetical protein